jgi:tetratricopeptide (TPR) repeat protein
VSKTSLALAAAAALAVVAAAAATTPAKPYNLERAIAAQQAIVAERPDDATLYNDLGNLLVLARDWDGAAAAYARSLELDPANANTHFNRALLLEKRGERLAAFRALKRAVELDPGQAWTHYEIGKIYQAWGVDPLAERAYARAFRLEPRLADARTNPHVLDNPLATRALLRAHERAGEDLQPPRTYEEPARIAALMIDLPKPAGDDPQLAAKPAAAAGEGGFVRSLKGAPAAGAADVEQEDVAEGSEPAKRLTARDLEPGRTTNQVGGGAAASVIGGAGSRATPSDKPIVSGRRVRTAPTLGPSRPGPGPSSPPPQGSPAPPPFDPGPDSTGRLEIRLLPVPAATGA